MAARWLKKGKEGQALTKKNEEDVAAKRAAAENKVFRFWVKQDEEKKVTFLDGELDGAGLLDVPRFWEHRLNLSGHWNNWFPCTKDDEPCPICETSQPSLVYVFTIVDHSEWSSEKSGVHKDERKLYVCKGETYKRLSKLAHKRDGLTGCTFDIGRLGDKSEAAGNDFDFIEKLSLKKIAKKYGLKEDGESNDNKVVQPYDYEAVLTYYTADELRKLGLGSGEEAVGSEDANEVKSKRSAAPSQEEFDNEL